MSKSKFFKLLALLAIASMVLAACGGGKKASVTSTGFQCPKPNPAVKVTSKELNIFVWTEYIPPDALDCFQLVYGITVNRDEYSSNEEMYAKLSAGDRKSVV